MMKRIFLLTLAAALLLSLTALAAPERTILIYTRYQSDWTHEMQLGWVDSAGEMWRWTGSAKEAGWPDDSEKQQAWMLSRADAESLGSLSARALSDISGLIQGVPEFQPQWRSAACDAGLEASYAVREGAALLLGGSGDEWCENTAPDAQALYLRLRQLFPDVTSFMGKADMGPAGFARTSVAAFCGVDADKLAGGRWTIAYLDCETGAGEETALESAPNFIVNGQVIGKANATGVTGNTELYTCYAPDGSRVATFEFYGELLVQSDGMYYVE